MTADSTIGLSAVIPLGPGDRADELARSLKLHPRIGEVIVSAAMPASGTLEICDRWIHGSAGRGVQLNRGAALARHSWLWFVHADSLLTSATVHAAAEFAAAGNAVIGYCRLRFSNDGPRLARLNALGANLRSWLLRQPYGDQGLCMPVEVFDSLGGFREDLPRGEDLDFVVRALAADIPIRPVGATITTSARRYREQGWLRTTLRHQVTAACLIRNARRSIRSDHP